MLNNIFRSNAKLLRKFQFYSKDFFQNIKFSFYSKENNKRGYVEFKHDYFER